MRTRVTLTDNLNRMNEKELTAWIASAAKRSNQRLRELEKQGLEKSSAAYRYVKRQAYDGTKNFTYDKQGRVKFSTNQRGMSFAEKKAYAFDLKEFEGAKSSTIKGMQEIEEKSARTFEENFGDSGVSYKDFSEAMSVDIMKELYRMYGSDVIVEIAEKTKGMTDEEIREALGDYATKDLSQIYEDIEQYQENKKTMDNDGGETFGDGVPL